MGEKREGLAELLLCQSSEIAPALTPTNQAQTNLAHILPTVKTHHPVDIHGEKPHNIANCSQSNQKGFYILDQAETISSTN